MIGFHKLSRISWNIKIKKILMTDFNSVSEKVNFSEEEEKIFKYWNEIDAFKLQLEKTKDFEKFTFYDGPPFATGLPHYGHITAGTIKDVVTRYASQTGHYVERRFGWDCHGLPVEYEIDKKLGLLTKEDHEKLGIAQYNKECKSIVMRYSQEWEQIVSRLGRWIDFKNDYKTMDLSFMDSVWWVFKQIFEKGLVYRGCKVMPYSMACTTVLSNFEAGQNYKDIFDPSVLVTFPLQNNPKEKLVAWTTTPWTLPSNLALAVHPDFIYVRIKDLKLSQLPNEIKDPEEVLIVAECRLDELYSKEKDKKKAYEVLSKCKGSELIGLKYVPLYDYFIDREKDGCFQVIGATYVTKDTGTGIVHQAPAFGEEDYKACLKHKLIRPDNPPCPIDANGRFTSEVHHFQGLNVKDADPEIKKDLKKKGRLIHESQIKHSYPFCWRSDTPLIYKAHHSWFIKVTDLKEKMLVNNMKSTWVPSFAQEKRFHNWLQNAEDWCFSRNRMWGNPIPIWVSDDYEEVVCVGSVKELIELSGVESINDIHREFIDHITIPSKQGKGVLKRIDEVFDCWFESGSMPYAQLNYPHSMNEEDFLKRFPADFISEGIDQTRGWFYTLNVISTALFDSHPYKNLIVNGLVLAEDGKKMSKRLNNYPNPMEVVNRLGADAIRLYLINSPLVKGESLNFKEQGVKDIIKDIFLPWYNAYRFLIQNLKRWETVNNTKFIFDQSQTEGSDNIMDKWIIAATENLIKTVKFNMGKYDLSASVPKLIQFLEQLTNWYVRLNRQRIKGELSLQQWTLSISILFNVIFKSAQMMSPFVPFITDSMYQNLRKVIKNDSPLQSQSIHFLQLPNFNQNLIDEQIEKLMSQMQSIIEIARNLREKKGVSLKQPIQSLSVIFNYKSDQELDNLKELELYIKEEVNCNAVFYSNQVDQFIEYQAIPNHKLLGQKLKKDYNNDFRNQVNNLSKEQIELFRVDKKITICNQVLDEEDIILKQSLKTAQLPEHKSVDIKDEFIVLLDLSQDEELKLKGLSREFINRIQTLRKQAKLNVEDSILVFYSINSDAVQLQKAIEKNMSQIQLTIKKPIYTHSLLDKHHQVIIKQQFNFDNLEFEIIITHQAVVFDNKKLEVQSQLNKDSQEFLMLKQAINCYSLSQLKEIVNKNSKLQNFIIKDGKFSLELDGKIYNLTQGQEFII